jgi:LmbE family N-acetylglucosaminyl deacetylase
MKWKVFQFFLILFLLFNYHIVAGAISLLPPITSQDRILILAPHPDDETIGTGGIIQKAIKREAKIKVVYLTNGEFNQFSYIIYEKRIPIRKKSFISLGKLRENEAKKAMKILGLSNKNLIFLGFPDRGTIRIFLRYWGDCAPYRNKLTRISKVPYKDAFSYGVEYRGENILSYLEKIIEEFKPTKIFVSHPVDTNPDHQAFYLYLKIALWDLQGKIPQCQVYPYLVHFFHWPLPKRYHPNLKLVSPLPDIKWFSYNSTPDEINKKFKAMICYKSQTKVSAHYLFSFIKENELFGDYPDLILKEDNHEFNWVSEHDSQYDSWSRKLLKHADIKEVSYALKGKQLYINTSFYNKISKNLVLNLYLLGYRKNISFAQMPKIRIKVKGKKYCIFDKSNKIKSKIETRRTNNSILIALPLKLMKNPDFIVSRVESYRYDLFLDSTAWRILKIEKPYLKKNSQ